MLSKLSALALLVPFVARTTALTLSTPTNLSSGGTATITWTNAAGDPSTFSLELVNTAFNNAFAIANNVEPGSGSITVALPIVPPGDGYTLEAVNISNINDAYSTTGAFSIAPTSSSSTSSGASSGSSSATSFGVSTTVTTVPSSSSSSSSGTSSAPSASTSSFNGASTVKFGSAGTYAAVLLSAIAGAAVVAF